MGSSDTTVDLTLREYEPRPMLTVEVHEVFQPRFPVIDVHNHQRRHCGSNPENANQAASARPAISVRSSAVSTGPSAGAVIRLKRNDAPQIAASETSRAMSPCLI